MSRLPSIVLVLACLAGHGCSGAPPAGAEVPAAVTPVPRHRAYPWMAWSKWYRMHAADVELAEQGEARVVFIGDSITEGWNFRGGAEWDRLFAPLGAVNFGIGGDMTQNLLWRLRNGLEGNLDPEAVVLMIGCNNIGFTDESPGAIAAGIEAVVEELLRLYENAHVLLLGILPRERFATHPNRRRVKAINELTFGLGKRERVTYLDVGPLLLEPDGEIAPSIMGDAIHPTEEGYRRIAGAIHPVLKKLLSE